MALWVYLFETSNFSGSVVGERSTYFKVAGDGGRGWYGEARTLLTGRDEMGTVRKMNRATKL